MRLSSPPEQKQDRSGFEANSSHNPHTVSRQGKERGWMNVDGLLPLPHSPFISSNPDSA